jgi:choline kinase
VSDLPIALILAAGFGKRLGVLTERVPKCLLQVGGRPLLLHSLDRIASAGLEHVLVVLGHGAAEVMFVLKSWNGPLRISTCHAPAFEHEGSLGSLRAGLLEVGPARGIVVLESDILYHCDFLTAALRSGTDTLLTADVSGSGDEVYVLADELGRLSSLGKQVTDEERLTVRGEFAGISHLGAGTSAAFIHCADAWLAAGRLDAHYEEALLQTCRAGTVSLRVCHCPGLPWTEVDNAADLARAIEVVWPALCTASAHAAAHSPQSSNDCG